MSFNNKFLETPLQHAIAMYNDQIVPRLTKKNKVIAIGAAVALSVYYLADKVLGPPKNLRHIPYFGYWSVIKSLIKGESYFDRGYKVNLAQVDSLDGGLYLEPGRNGWEVHVSNPDDAKLILLKHEKFPKINSSEGNQDTLFTKFVGGPNVLVVNGHKWKAQRKVLNPAFHRSMPVKLFGKLGHELFETLDNLNLNDVEVTKLLLRWTLDAISSAGFGFDFHAVSDLESKWVTAYSEIKEGIRDRKYFVFPSLDQGLRWMFPKRQKLHIQLDHFMEMLDEIIINKRNLLKEGHVENDALEENERDLLTLMIESENRGEGILTDEELKANLCLFFFAGHDTTSNALSFTLYHLAKHPDIQQRARQEAIIILGDEPKDSLPSLENTKQLKFINQIIKETLRLNCPAPRVVPRLVTEDTFLSNTFIPKGTYVTVDIFCMHHSNKLWKNADQFDPDRFAEDREGVRASGAGVAWLAFGNGARQCLGINFSVMEQRVMLLMLLKKFTWTLPEDSKHKDGIITAGFPIVGPVDLHLSFKKRY